MTSKNKATLLKHSKEEKMRTKSELRGVIAAIVTPFTEDEKLDEEGLRKVTNHLLKKGIHGIMTTGGNGEGPHLSQEERKTVTRVVVDVVKGQIPVIAGTAACSTTETILLTKDAAEAGATAAIVTPPFYYILSDKCLYRHYERLAASVDIPIVVYNNPLYTGNNLQPELIAGLANIDGIIGLKQSNPDLGQLVEVIRLVGNNISILTGIDSQFYPSLCAGSKGIFSTAACVVPQQMVDLFNAFEKGSHAAALAIHMKLQNLNHFFEYDPGYVAPCKEALMILGLPAGPVREPLPRLTEQQKTQIRQALVMASE
jgi:4-hydroxy-tetrahydrodipicolinate synthase